MDAYVEDIDSWIKDLFVVIKDTISGLIILLCFLLNSNIYQISDLFSQPILFAFPTRSSSDINFCLPE